MAENYNSQWTGEQIDEAVGLARQGSIITGAEATTLAAGSTATATVENNVLKIGVPVGATGPQGPQGETGATGPQGPAYTLTDTDKNAIAEAVKASLTTETWTFTLEDGSTVTKAVYVGEVPKVTITIIQGSTNTFPDNAWVEIDGTVYKASTTPVTIQVLAGTIINCTISPQNAMGGISLNGNTVKSVTNATETYAYTVTTNTTIEIDSAGSGTNIIANLSITEQ